MDVNLDCMDRGDLVDFCGNAANAIELRRYALLAIRASDARVSGNVTAALSIERDMQAAYDRLPVEMKW